MSNQRRRKRSNKRLARTTALSAPQTQINEIQLAAGGDSTGVTVDHEAGIIANVAVLTGGPAFPAAAEPFMIDEVMLSQCVDAINNQPKGVKSRISHPELAGGPHWVGGDSIFHLVGRCRNAKMVGSQVRADMHIGKYAASSPNGDMRSYLLTLAEEDPSACGVSIRFIPADSVAGDDNLPIGRILKVTAVDFVGTPGGNPNGLLSGEQAEHSQQGRGDGSPGETSNGDTTMKLNKAQRAFLASCGLAAGASNEQIQTCLSGLNEGQKTYFESIAGDDVPAPATKPAPVEPVQLAVQTAQLSGDEQTAAVAAAEKATLAAERQRHTDILALASGDDAAVTVETARRWADEGTSLANAQELARMAREYNALPVGRVEVGADLNLSTLEDGISDALMLRSNNQLMDFDPVTGLAARDDNGNIITRQPHERAASMRHLSIGELARQQLSAIGVPQQQLNGMSIESAISLASGSPEQRYRQLSGLGCSMDLAMSTGDFNNILANTANKIYLGGYNLARGTWQHWCSRITAPDFKSQNMVNLSGPSGLNERLEGAGITFKYMSDSGEAIALIEYTDGLVFTRKAQINDDLGVLREGGIATLGAMASYKEDDVAYARLTVNADMSDGTALFHADHGNLSSSGSSTPVYFASAPGLCPTMKVMFLESEQAPVLKQQNEWDTDDLKIAVRHTVAAAPADWRGMYKEITGNVTVTSLGVVSEAMQTQTAPNGAFMNLMPVFIICPVGASQVKYAQLVGSNVDPSKSNATKNPFFNQFTVVGEPRLNV